MVNILVVELDRGDESDWKEILTFLSGKMCCQVSRMPLPVSFGEKNRDVLIFPGLEIQVKEQTALRDGEPVHLSHYEFFTLCYLAQHPGWVFTKSQIYEAVWKQPGEKCEASVSNVISQLRKKLDPANPRNGYIRTVINSGYKFEGT